MNYTEVLSELENLVSETFDLWDHNRIGFQWQNYTWNHTMRVRAMSIELGKREGGDTTKLEVAGTLHDITKRYDGEILTDENGKRVLDHNGFWLNEPVAPVRSNVVTRLYHDNDLYGQVHHESGAVITEKILEMYDFEQDFVDAVSAIVLAHLKPTNLSGADYDMLYRNVENQILYDVDTIDPNLGYTAFFRNVHIHSYFALQRGGFDLETYVRGLPRFVDTKQEFVGKLLTESALTMRYPIQKSFENVNAIVTLRIALKAMQPRTTNVSPRHARVDSRIYVPSSIFNGFFFAMNSITNTTTIMNVLTTAGRSLINISSSSIKVIPPKTTPIATKTHICFVTSNRSK